MSTLGTLDTNVLLRLVLNDVPAPHQAATGLLARAGTFDVPLTAMIEAVFALETAYGIPRAGIVGAVQFLASHPSLECETAVLVAACQVYLEHPSLSFVDCVLVVAADRSGASPLWTFDRKLASQTTAELVPPPS